jgi:3',5'-cyclic AMP phosphodiesterase CpdA
MRRSSISVRIILLAAICFSLAGWLLDRSPGQQGSQKGSLTLPNRQDSFHFAVIGDSGTGGNSQYRIAELLEQYRKAFPYKVVLMMGDNIYGSERPADYEEKFGKPYRPLLEAGVKFYASLGNHDEPAQSQYKPFNMNGKRFYSFQPHDRIRFFALDSNYMSEEQVKWLEKELRDSNSDWKICFFHHPIYSPGERHGSDVELRKVIEPLFVKYGVDVVFSGHEHFYARVKPQQGIAYFISGSAAKLRRHNIADSELTAKGFDSDYSFMLVEIAGDEMHFQTISAQDQTVDSGVVPLRDRGSNKVSQVSGGEKTPEPAQRLAGGESGAPVNGR